MAGIVPHALALTGLALTAETGKGLIVTGTEALTVLLPASVTVTV